MADIDWPSDLDLQLDISGYLRQPEDGTVRTEMDSGPGKARQRDTSMPEDIDGVLHCNATERATFWFFFKDTLGQGTMPFNWLDPVTLDAVEMEFRDSRPSETSPTQGRYLIAMKLRILT